MIIQNEDVGSIITWDFDVLRNGVCFSIFRTKNPLTTSGSENTEHKSVIEKSWKEGHDFFRVETSTVCHDGESVQV